MSSMDRDVAARRLSSLLARTSADLPATTTVAVWLEHWLGHVAGPRVRPRTLDTYRGYADRYLIPHLGKRRLDELRPEHVRAMHEAMTSDGLSSTTCLQAHRILARALVDARREGHSTVDLTDLMDAPRRATSTRGALTAEQAVTLLRSVDGTAMGTRWAAAVLLGARQGECLGLEWDRVDLDAGTVDLAWQLQRLAHRHGCLRRGEPTCGHIRAGSCPARELDVRPDFEYRPVRGGLVLTRPKSRAGLRVVPLPPSMWQALAWHRRPASGQGLVWTTPAGGPIDPRADSAGWRAAVAAAGLPAVPLHAARHTTATLLGRAGVSVGVVSSILGHSTAAMTQAYQHADITLQRQAMDGLGGMLALD